MSFKPGDLVMVVKEKPCGCDDTLGKIHSIVSQLVFVSRTRCPSCGKELGESKVHLVSNNRIIQPSRLRKIDPLTEQDKTETLQEVHA